MTLPAQLVLFDLADDDEEEDEAGNLVFDIDFRSLLQSVLSDGLALDARALLGGPWPQLALLEPA